MYWTIFLHEYLEKIVQKNIYYKNQINALNNIVKYIDIEASESEKNGVYIG